MDSVESLFRVDGKVAVVTGASRGIGRGIVDLLGSAGAKLVIVGRDRGSLDRVEEELRRREVEVIAIATDLTTDGAFDDVATRAIAAFGRIDIWVNNVGGLPDATPRSLKRTSRDQFDAQIELNLTTVWAGAVAAARHMADGGSIINLSSRASSGGHPANGPYAAAKAAVNSLTETLAIELAPRIRVNAIAPGPVPTDNFLQSIENGIPLDRRDSYLEAAKGPLGRLGTPVDIAAGVLYLASPASSWVTGTILRITGGR